MKNFLKEFNIADYCINNTNHFKTLKKSRVIDPDFLTRKQAADYLNINISTLHRWTKEGLIIARGLGHRVYYNITDLKSAMKQIN